MTDAKLPDPLVPAEVDLRDFGFMPLDALRLRDSDLAIEASAEVFRASVLLWCASWHQVPAGSLPLKDKTLADYSRAGARWPRIRAEVLSKWQECSDGRLYHPVVAEKALAAWNEKLAQRARTRAATWAREAKKNAPQPTRDEQRDVARDEQRDEQRDVARDDSSDVDQGIVKGEGREGKEEKGPPTPPPVEAGVRGLAGKALKRAGLNPMQFSLDAPRFIALVGQGATPDEFEAIGREAVAKGIKAPFPWVLTVLQSRRTEAAAIVLAPVTPAAAVATTPSRDATVTAEMLRQRSTPLTPEEKARADEARKRAMQALTGRG